MTRLALLHTRTPRLHDAPAVQVEVHLAPGLPRFTIVGLPEASVRESKDRVRSAIQNSGYRFPDARITVNLSPAHLPKEGSRFDLAIAVGILSAAGHVQNDKLDQYEWVAELGLNGDIRPVFGCLACAMTLHQQDTPRAMVCHPDNAWEAKRWPGLTVLPVQRLGDVCDHLNQRRSLSPQPLPPPTQAPPIPDCFEAIQGHYEAKYALMLAAAGRHHLLMIGPPGVGKTMLARCLPHLLPPLNQDDALQAAAWRHTHEPLHQEALNLVPPFVAPHHSASYVGLVGGGNPPRPGAITHAHHGVLFLDELGQYPARTLETLREPLEQGWVHITRAGQTVRFPCQFQLVAAMNPPTHAPDHDLSHLSRPWLDRMGLVVPLTCPTHQPWGHGPDTSLPTRVALAQIRAARERQTERGTLNRNLEREQLLSITQRTPGLHGKIDRMMETGQLSMRRLCHTLRLAQTIADVEDHPVLTEEDLHRALSFNPNVPTHACPTKTASAR